MQDIDKIIDIVGNIIKRETTQEEREELKKELMRELKSMGKTVGLCESLKSDISKFLERRKKEGKLNGTQIEEMLSKIKNFKESKRFSIHQNCPM